LAGSAGVTQQFNRLGIGVSTNISRFRYDPYQAGAVTIDQSDRNRTTVDVTGRVAYEISALASVFSSATLNRIDYQKSVDGVVRDSKGYNVVGGFSFEFSEILHGQVGIGYLSQQFKDPRYPNFHGLNYNVDLNYSPTRLINIHLTGQRSIENSALVGVPGVLESTIRATVNYNPVRDIIVVVTAQYQDQLYRGIDRNQKNYLGQIAVNKIINRLFALYVQYTRERQTSSGTSPGRPFLDNSVTLGVTIYR
jgi:hypothetical protein